LVAVAARGLDNGLWQRVYDNGWGDWRSLGGYITTSPGASASSTPNGGVVMALGANGRIWATTIGPRADGQWLEWPYQTPNGGGAPGRSSILNGRFDLWLVGPNMDVMHMGAVSWGPQRIDVYVNIGHVLQHKWTNI